MPGWPFLLVALSVGPALGVLRASGRQPLSVWRALRYAAIGGTLVPLGLALLRARVGQCPGAPCQATSALATIGFWGAVLAFGASSGALIGALLVGFRKALRSAGERAANRRASSSQVT